MIAPALIAIYFAIGQVAPPTSIQAINTPAPTAAKAESNPDIDKTKSLCKVRRIFVESFGTDPIAQQMQAMVVSSLTESKRFTVTEDKSKADAVLKGSGTERTSQEMHAYGSGTAVSTANGASHAYYGSTSGSASGAFRAVSGATNDSSVNTETLDNAHASVRLVNADGDVIWTTTQESGGAKFKGASADVADKIAKQLVRDAERADRGTGDSQGK